MGWLLFAGIMTLLFAGMWYGTSGSRDDSEPTGHTDYFP